MRREPRTTREDWFIAERRQQKAFPAFWYSSGAARRPAHTDFVTGSRRSPATCRDTPTPKFAATREIACRQSPTMSGRPRTDPPAAMNDIVPVPRLFPRLLALGARPHVPLDELRVVVAHRLTERRHARVGNPGLADHQH